MGDETREVTIHCIAEDARNLVHYYRLTADNRIVMGGRDVSLDRNFFDMDRDERDERVVYRLGCVGHGVSLTHLNRQTIGDHEIRGAEVGPRGYQVSTKLRFCGRDRRALAAE